MKPASPATITACVIVVGAGNIGAPLIPLLAHLPGLARVIIIDRDIYQDANLRTQAVLPAEVGKPKALVQARRLRRLNPALRVTALVADVEDIPLGRLRACALLGCVDSRRARLRINEIAWRLQMPLIDAGVMGEGLLARVNMYLPRAGNPCLECAWDERDYAAVETRYACQTGGLAATNAPAALGALAASLMALECGRLLQGEDERALINRQVVIDARHHRHYLTGFQLNPRCRFDHAIWPIRPLQKKARHLTLAQLLQYVSADHGAGGAVNLAVAGQSFVAGLCCRGCGRRQSVLQLERGFRSPDCICTQCGRAELGVDGFALRERLDIAGPWQRWLGQPLDALGLQDGDVIAITDESGSSYLEIGSGSQADQSRRNER